MMVGELCNKRLNTTPKEAWEHGKHGKIVYSGKRQIKKCLSESIHLLKKLDEIRLTLLASLNRASTPYLDTGLDA